MSCCEKLPKNSIMLTQGDDSNAMGHYIKIKLTTEADMTGWYAIVQLEKFQWRYDDLTSGELAWIIPRDITAQLSVGEHDAAIKIFDANDKCCTVVNNIQVFVNAMSVENPTTPESED